jgi:hypothetical protein
MISYRMSMDIYEIGEIRTMVWNIPFDVTEG